MELKAYQKEVIEDLSQFLSLLVETQSIEKSYNTVWQDKGVRVGLDGMPYYNNTIKGVPQVCIKVPTGGGKTFISSASLKPIFSSIPTIKTKAVVWLVPSDAILTQTYKALSNPNHPYRQKIDVDFGGRVEVYSKAQLLNGQNFNPTSVAEQLSIFVLSYDSFRSAKKEGRKAFQENGNLASFSQIQTDKKDHLPDIDETALIQVVRTLNPVVIVDESHHATSDLSIDMLKDFNPCFILDLTATPKEGANIISIVDALKLKKENMVKLPVIVYNRKTQEDVLEQAITIRMKLEAEAKKEQETSGRYIRPIVLFQAEPKNKNDSTTYEKLKTKLVEIGIPENHIAIKTADKDELKNIDLLSPECQIRYIITVNALKEGWDCPFAYVLATIANRTSVVDVEQILGRVLRLPYTKTNANKFLNLSYVLTCSSSFQETLTKIVKGLNEAGFSDKDYRTKDELLLEEKPTNQAVQPNLSTQDDEDIFDSINTDSIREAIEKVTNQSTTAENINIAEDEIFSIAQSQNQQYEDDFMAQENPSTSHVPSEVRDKMNNFHVHKDFEKEIEELRIPQFMLEIEASLFSDNEKKVLEEENLTKDFTLANKDTIIDFSTIDSEMAQLDIREQEPNSARIWQLKQEESDILKKLFAGKSSKTKLSLCKDIIKQNISKLDYINDKELDGYIEKVLESLSPDQLTDLEQTPFSYGTKIKAKINSLVASHRIKQFDLWLEQGKITCEESYALPKTISPTNSTGKFSKSLYAKEDAMNGLEEKLVWKLLELDNIRWWHRNISKRGFCINGSQRAYPDFIVCTESKKILMLETKGAHLDGEQSRTKAKIGKKWENYAGRNYRYYMIFENEAPDIDGMCSLDRFLEIVKGL